MAHAAVSVFLTELLSIVPLIGIRAFSPSKTEIVDSVAESALATAFDTIVVAARQHGFKDMFTVR